MTLQDSKRPPGNDQLGDKFLAATVMFRRQIQLQAGARPRVEPHRHSFTRIAFLEVAGGLVSWDSGLMAVPKA